MGKILLLKSLKAGLGPGWTPITEALGALLQCQWPPWKYMDTSSLDRFFEQGLVFHSPQATDSRIKLIPSYVPIKLIPSYVPNQPGQSSKLPVTGSK